MPTEKKIETVAELEKVFARSNIVVLTDYRGLTAPQMTTLRRRLRQSKGEYHVVKNTLARLAADKTGKGALDKALTGPIGLAIGGDDIVTPVRALSAFIPEVEGKLIIKGGFLGDRLLTREEVLSLVTLPSREVLLARVLGQMQAPIAGLLYALNGPLQGLLGILQARVRQLEEK